MSVFEQAGFSGHQLRRARWVSFGAAAALVLGGAAAVNSTLGMAVALLIAVLAATVLRPVSVLTILIVSVFVEVISVGGVTIARLIAPIALFVVVVELLRGGVALRGGPQLLWVGVYSTLALASGLWTVSTSLTLTLLGSLAIALTYMLCFGALLDSEDQLRRVLHVLALGSLVVGAWSLLSFAGYSFGPTNSLQAGRAEGGVGDPNFFANVQLVALPLILVLAAEAKNSWLRYGLGFTAFVALASVLSTLSRGGLIALTFVLLAIPFIPARALFASPRQKALIMVVLAVGLGALFTRPTFRADVVARATMIFTAGQANSDAGSGRTEIWKAAQQSVSERPLLGVGFGAFPAVSNDLMMRTPGVDLERLAPHPNGIEAHNAYLGTTADLGFPGLAVFLALIFSTGVALRRTAVKARNAGALFVGRVSNALVLSLAGWAISSIFIETETARPLWTVIGISLALPKMIAAAGTAQPVVSPRQFS